MSRVDVRPSAFVGLARYDCAVTENQTHTTLPGSERDPAIGVTPGEAIPSGEIIEATVILRRRAPLPSSLVEGGETVTAADFASLYGADPADLELVTRTLTETGITVVDTDAAARSIGISGPSGLLETFFDTSLTRVESIRPDGATHSHRHRTGGLSVPLALEGVVIAVLGLDDRAQARAMFSFAAPEAVSTSYTPLQLGEHYSFPSGTDGAGQRVAVIELGGGFAQTDLDAYFSSLGIAGPTVTALPVDGGSNVAGQDPQGADGEVLLDLEVIGALAPGAELLAYFSPNTDRGFVDAIAAAAHATPTPTAISISWGGPESSWTAQGRASMDAALADAAALGVTVTVAAGDNGSGDGVASGVHVDFPASSPHSLACGGTRLTSLTGPETVWGGITGDGATGGGVSVGYPLPTWQQHAGVPAAATGRAAADDGGASDTRARSKKGGRGVPDVAGNADPQTGWVVRIDGSDEVIGGTSAVAPLWAALVARLAQGLGRPLGLLAPLLYAGVIPGAATAGFHDVISGSNGAYRAGPGWDPCTGLGTPDGQALLGLLQQPPPAR